MAHSPDCKACKKNAKLIVVNEFKRLNDLKNQKEKSPEFIEKHKKLDEEAKTTKELFDSAAKELLDKQSFCETNLYSSRMCEFGTASCIVKHKELKEFAELIEMIPEPKQKTMGERLQEAIKEKAKEEQEKLITNANKELYNNFVDNYEENIKNLKEKGILSSLYNIDNKGTIDKLKCDISKEPNNVEIDIDGINIKVSLTLGSEDEFQNDVKLSDTFIDNCPFPIANSDNIKLSQTTQLEEESLKAISSTPNIIQKYEYYPTISEMTNSHQNEILSLKDEINKLKEEFAKYNKIEITDGYSSLSKGFIKYGENKIEDGYKNIKQANPLRRFVIRFEESSKRILLLSVNQETLDWNNKNGNMMNTILKTTVEPYLRKAVTLELLKEFTEKLYDILSSKFPEELFQLTYIPISKVA